MKWIFLLALVTAAGCAHPAASEDKDAVDAAPVEVEIASAVQRPIRQLIQVRGAFVPAQGSVARLCAAASGRITSVLVHEGDQVRAGQLLATLDSGVQAAQAASATAAANAAAAQSESTRLSSSQAQSDAQANVQSAELALQIAESTRDADVRQDRLALESAQADETKIRAGARPQEISQAHQAVIQAEVARNKASRDYDRDASLASEGYVSKKQLEESRSALDTATAALTSAQAEEALVRAGARPEELRSAHLRVQAARAALNDAILLDAQRVEAARVTVRQARRAAAAAASKGFDAAAGRSTATEKAADARASRAAQALTEIRAPYSGRITRRLLNPGDVADTTTAVLEVSGSNLVDFQGSIPAADSALIRIGMAAQVTTPSGGLAEGRVVNTTPAETTTGLATVRIACATNAQPGADSTASVVIATIKDAIAVPSDCVLNRDGADLVFLVSGDAAKQTKVKPGATDGDWTQIIEGVPAGAKLVKLGQYELTDGAKVKQAAKKESGESDDKGAGGAP